MSLQWKTMEIFHFLPTRQVNSQAYDITANTPIWSGCYFHWMASQNRWLHSRSSSCILVTSCILQLTANAWQTILISHQHCRQRAPVGIVLSSSGTSQLGMFDIQATTKSKYYDHIVLLYLESRRCRYRSIIFVCFYLYVSMVNLIDYIDIYKMMDINNEKC